MIEELNIDNSVFISNASDACALTSEQKNTIILPLTKKIWKQISSSKNNRNNYMFFFIGNWNNYMCS